jgi:hypothetical protein
VLGPHDSSKEAYAQESAIKHSQARLRVFMSRAWIDMFNSLEIAQAALLCILYPLVGKKALRASPWRPDPESSNKSKG